VAKFLWLSGNLFWCRSWIRANPAMLCSKKCYHRTMAEVTAKLCDNKSVGIIVRNPEGSFALLKRAYFPIGYAPVAGHVDDHGSVEQAAVDEVIEEIDLTVTVEDL